jgi:FixJ family two-component response regulator
MAPTNPRIVLYVEDEPAHAKLVERAFQKTDYLLRLKIVYTLADALRYLKTETPHLIVADYMLSDGEGTELINYSMEKSLPVILITSHGSEAIAVDAMKKGAFDYVVKTESTFAEMPRIAHQAIKEYDLILNRRKTERLMIQITQALTTQLIVINQNGEVLLSNAALANQTFNPLFPQDGLKTNYLHALQAYQGEYRELVSRYLQWITNHIQGMEQLTLHTVEFQDDAHHLFYDVRIKTILNTNERQVLITIDDVTERVKQQLMAQQKELHKARLDRLSRRERQVLQLVSEGISNKVIASQLHLSDRTVEKHRASAMKKLSVRSVADVVKIFMTVDE